ncbi:HNH endonuclease signature motif containing protein [Edaphobacter aggregans]|uniref:HNH endonuclease n=1 Tax=Edaphobacter aggregans TaxID=570835 RepID=UPI0005566D2A
MQEKLRFLGLDVHAEPIVAAIAAQDVDHVEPIRMAPERRLDMINLQSLCRACHRVKTAQDHRNDSAIMPCGAARPCSAPSAARLPTVEREPDV